MDGEGQEREGEGERDESRRCEVERGLGLGLGLKEGGEWRARVKSGIRQIRVRAAGPHRM